jgi:hypothetical protein
MLPEIRFKRSDFAKAHIALAGVKNGVPRVMMRAINKTIAGVRTDAVKEISGEITATQKVIRGRFVIRKATMANQGGEVITTGRPLGLIHFKARQTKKGVSVQVKCKSKRTLLKHAFIAVTKGGAKNVFWRKWKEPRTTGRGIIGAPARLPECYRLPLERLTGPRVQDIFDDPPIMAAVLKKAQERLDKNFTHETDYMLSKL